MMMMIMRHPVALFICAVIGFMIHKTQSDDELELFCAIAAAVALPAASATTVGAILPPETISCTIYIYS